MRLAIHKSHWGFSPDWIEYCKKKGIPYKIVNCYESNIISQIDDCDALMWHHHHSLAKDKVFAKKLLFALEQAGIQVFPNFNSNWHFDDKLGQKYLLEAINAPLVPTEVFYDKETAIKWTKSAIFPKVFKLKGGAGSSNVRLVNKQREAIKLIRTAFGKGFSLYNSREDLRENIRKYRLGKNSFKNLIKSIRRLIMSTEFAKIHGREKGYVLFQDFIPNNQFDIRVITIADKAFALKRLVRKGDFRASGSGFITYNKDEIDERCVKIAFDTTEKLKSQCVAYDFIFDKKNNPLIVEINYGFAHEAYFPCPGYWDKEMNWHKTSFNATHWMVDLIINEKKK